MGVTIYVVLKMRRSLFEEDIIYDIDPKAGLLLKESPNYESDRVFVRQLLD